MKRDKFLKRVANMCGPAEAEAVQHLAALPPKRRLPEARKLGQAATDPGLTDFLTSLIEDDFIDDLASLLPGGNGHQEAEELLKRLWARLLLLIGPEAKDVLYAHNQLRLTSDQRSRRGSVRTESNIDAAHRSALENARAVLAATKKVDSDQASSQEAQASPSTAETA
jgi:hypothetical protein